MNRDIIQLMRMNDLAYSSVPERGPAVADVEIADSFISWNSAAATTEAASATRPNEAAIPEATFDSASASEDGLSSFGVTESESISLKEAVVLSTTMGLFLVTADTTLAPKVAIFFWSLFKNLMYYWFLAVLRFLYSWISTGKSDLFFATVFKRNKFNRLTISIGIWVTIQRFCLRSKAKDLGITWVVFVCCRRPKTRNYLSCCCSCTWIFHLIYALSTSTTMLPPFF